jgi:hypothetical protein
MLTTASTDDRAIFPAAWMVSHYCLTFRSEILLVS